MPKLILLPAFMLLTFSIALGATAETPVIGFIAQDTTWTQANSPYVTLGNIIVKEGVTLTIESGVTIQFDSGHSLTIEGTLIARGTDKQGIKFTPKGDKWAGAWGGIVFEGSSTDAKFDDADNYVSGSILQYCTVEFAGTGVEGNFASPFIDHCVISNNADGGISILGDNVVIRDSMITDNKGRGMFIGYSDNATITKNTVTGNGNMLKGHGGGIYASGAGGATAAITDNILTGNAAIYGGGIYVKYGTIAINNNVLTKNAAEGGGGIYVADSATVTISNNILTGNMVKDNGGGIYVGSHVGVSDIKGAAIISNNTLAENIAAFGGGIYVKSGDTVTISHNTLTENTAKGGSYVGDLFAIDTAGGFGTAIYYFCWNSQDIIDNLIANNVAEGDGTSAVHIVVGNPTFTGNVIIGNRTKFNLYYERSKGSPNLNATNNYWGVTTEAEIRVKIGDVFANNSLAIVDVVPFLTENPLPLGSLTVMANPKVLSADGVSTATITATLKDSKGNPVVDEPLAMFISQGTGKLSEVKNNGNGAYTATYTASRTVGGEIIFISAPKSYAAKSIEIQLTEPGVLPPKTLTIPDTEAAAGGTVDIPVEIDDITGLAKAEIFLGYDAKFLEMQDVSGTDLIEGLTLTTAVLAGKIFLEDAKGLAGGSGAMFHVTFKIAKDAPVGETEIKFESIALYDETGKEIPSTGTNGKLNVKEYQPLSSFTLSLDEGINIVSLPVQPQTPFTARSLAEKFSATMVINYDGKQGGFIAFVPEVFEEDGFPIEGGRGYIVNLLESKEVTFTGTVWSNAPSSISDSPSKKDSHWAFVVCGEIYDESKIAQRYTELTVTVENLRTGAVAQTMVNQLEQGKFAIALVDMNRNAVVSADELLKVCIIDADGNVISGPIKHRVSVEEITKGYVTFNMRLGDVIPEKSALLQNYPNPFNPETWIPYQLAQGGNVVLTIYDINGQLVRAINLGYKREGLYLSKDKAAYWDGRNELREKVSSGVYFYSIEAGNFRATKKLVVAK